MLEQFVVVEKKQAWLFEIKTIFKSKTNNESL